MQAGFWFKFKTKARTREDFFARTDKGKPTYAAGCSQLACKLLLAFIC